MSITPSPAPPRPLKNTGANPRSPGATPSAQGTSPVTIAIAAPIRHQDPRRCQEQ